MGKFAFVTLDVFTDRRFGGNPLAVFPDAMGISDADMLALTREFNLSETTFVLPPQDPANTAKVRIFCAAGEMPFAGHPMVGTGFVVGDRRRDLNALRFEVPAGIVAVDLTRNGSGEVVQAVIAAPRPLTLGQTLNVAEIAGCAGLAPEDIVTDHHPPILASVGNPFVIAEVTPAALTRAQPDMAGFQRAAKSSGLQDRLSLHLYAHDHGRIRARMFAPLTGLAEDPATGSANAPLAALLLSLHGKDRDSFEVIQGVEMGRPSLLQLTASKGPDGITATVGGGCVRMFEGSVSL